MSTTSASQNSPTVTQLVGGIVGDVQDLGRQHLALFRREVQQDVLKASDAASSLAIGLAVAQVGGLLICLMLVHMLAALVPSLSLWNCYGIVGSVILIIGGVAVFIGIQKLRSVRSLGSETAEAVMDDAKWLSR